MLIIAGILFGMAVMLWFVDKWMDHPSINLMWLVRILIIAAMLLIFWTWIK